MSLFLVLALVSLLLFNPGQGLINCDTRSPSEGYSVHDETNY